jgi:archaemetzincin
MRTVTIIPIGIGNPSGLKFLKEGIEENLPVACRIGTPIPIPAEAYNGERKQYLSTALLRCLKKAPAAGGVTIGIADRDLYVPDLNFVFGEAEMGGTACVISLYRLRQEIYCLKSDRNLFERRAITEAVHELGHTLGLRHCPDPRCVMFFSNSLVDTDRKGWGLCETCRSVLAR